MNAPPDQPFQPSLLLASADAAALQPLALALGTHHKVQCTTLGSDCLALASGPRAPDLMLVDSRLHDMDGLAVCRELLLTQGTPKLTVLLCTDSGDADTVTQALALGVVDVLAKPVHVALAAARITTQLALRNLNQSAWEREQLMQQRLTSLADDVVQTQDAIVLTMASLAEPADVDTGKHILRTQAYVRALATQLSRYAPFSQWLGPGDIDLLLKATPLHDIGNVGIPDRILLKPARLSESELTVMKTHTRLGRDAIERIDRTLGQRLPFLAVARQIALSHHERWDGRGYPQGLAAEQIPLPARLMAVADVYDALISQRVYKDGLTHHQAVDIIAQNRASHFDPDLVDAFMEIEREFAAIALRLADTEDDLQRKIEYMANAIAENP